MVAVLRRVQLLCILIFFMKAAKSLYSMLRLLSSNLTIVTKIPFFSPEVMENPSETACHHGTQQLPVKAKLPTCIFSDKLIIRALLQQSPNITMYKLRYIWCNLFTLHACGGESSFENMAARQSPDFITAAVLKIQNRQNAFIEKSSNKEEIFRNGIKSIN